MKNHNYDATKQRYQKLLSRTDTNWYAFKGGPAFDRCTRMGLWQMRTTDAEKKPQAKEAA